MDISVEELLHLVAAILTANDLEGALAAITPLLGFQYFALVQHVATASAAANAIRVHNYPTDWADLYQREGLGLSDPVHRASHRTNVGFPWSRISELIPLNRDDHRMMARGREAGIGDGFTIPANIPGEAFGSCSFANGADRPMPHDRLLFAQLAGSFAFDTARRLWRPDLAPNGVRPTLTDRQRECLRWAARGKSDWEAGRIIGISEETVTRHLKLALERYDVPKRALLAIRALADGMLSFDEVLRR